MQRIVKVALFYSVAGALALLLLDKALGTDRPVLSLAALVVLWAAAGTAHTLRDSPSRTRYLNALLALAIVAWLIVGFSDLAESRHTLVYGAIGIASFFSPEILTALRGRRFSSRER